MCYRTLMEFKEAAEILKNPKNVRFADLVQVCEAFFGECRRNGSHHVFRVPWAGEPFVNIQADGKSAKPYQVKQVRRALAKLEAMKGEQK